MMHEQYHLHQPLQRSGSKHSTFYAAAGVGVPVAVTADEDCSISTACGMSVGPGTTYVLKGL